MPTTYSYDVVTTLFEAALALLDVTTISVVHTPVDALDTGADAECDHCTEATLTTAQVYFRSLATGEDVMVTGCAPCMVKVVAADADPAVTVQVETERAQ